MAHFAVKCGVRAFPSLACASLEIDREGNSSRHLLLSASFSTLFGVPDATRARRRDRLERENSAYSSSYHPRRDLGRIARFHPPVPTALRPTL